MNRNPDPQWIVEDGQAKPLSVKQRLLFDWAVELFTKSVQTGLDYCKTMATASTAAIPLYYGLFVFIVPDDWIADEWWLKLLVAGPALAFLLASVVFAIGCFPDNARLNLDNLEAAVGDESGTSVEGVRASVLADIKGVAKLGTFVFALAVIGSAIVVAWVAFDESRDDEAGEPQKVLVVNDDGTLACGDLLVGGVGTPTALVVTIAGEKLPAVPIVNAMDARPVESCPS